MEVLGEQLSWAVIDGFAPLPPGPHQPRVMIDRLVIHRETWAFDATGIGWVFAGQPAQRFLGAQAWRATHQLPMAAFYKLPDERKPIFVEFSSVPLVDCLAQAVRRVAAADSTGRVRVHGSPARPWADLVARQRRRGLYGGATVGGVDPTAGQQRAGAGAAGGTP